MPPGWSPRSSRSSTSCRQKARPVDISPPTISGVATEGQRDRDTRSWSNSPSGYTYPWQDCERDGLNCSPIPKATAQTYTLTST